MIGRMLLTATGAAVLSVHLWHAHQRTVFDQQLSAMADDDGFIAVQMPNNAPPHTVLILAPLNCPSDAAKRADALARFLTERGVPNLRMAQYAIAGVTPDMKAVIEHTSAVLTGALPAVVIDGRGKSNPTAQEVVDEYDNDQS